MIYYWWDQGSQFWLFTLYDKDEASDLTAKERGALAAMLRHEIAERTR